MSAYSYARVSHDGREDDVERAGIGHVEVLAERGYDVVGIAGSSMGAMVECDSSVAPGTELAIDIVGVGPVRGIVRWAQSGRFGVQFDHQFDLTRLAPKKEQRDEVRMLTPSYLDRRQAS